MTILGAVRGIDSWGSDVEAPYHIDATKEINYSFKLEKDRAILEFIKVKRKNNFNI